jgi:hypothetical protein
MVHDATARTLLQQVDYMLIKRDDLFEVAGVRRPASAGMLDGGARCAPTTGSHLFSTLISRKINGRSAPYSDFVVPSGKVTAINCPPGVPSRSGWMSAWIFKPGVRVLGSQPSRAKALGPPSSIAHCFDCP